MKKGVLAAVLLVLLVVPLAYAFGFDDFKSSFFRFNDWLTGSAVDSPGVIFGLGDSWNLVSVPFKDSVVSGCDKAYYYDSENKKYEKVVSVEGVLPLEHGKGYWIRGPCTLKVEGSAPAGVSDLGLKKDAVLYSGYNLLGVTKNGFNLQQNKGSCEFEKVYYYDGTRYIPVDYTNQNLEEGKSYWVKVKLEEGKTCKLQEVEFELPDKITDVQLEIQGASQGLKVMLNGEIIKKGQELPPMEPFRVSYLDFYDTQKNEITTTAFYVYPRSLNSGNAITGAVPAGGSTKVKLNSTKQVEVKANITTEENKVKIQLSLTSNATTPRSVKISVISESGKVRISSNGSSSSNGLTGRAVEPLSHANGSTEESLVLKPGESSNMTLFIDEDIGHRFDIKIEEDFNENYTNEDYPEESGSHSIPFLDVIIPIQKPAIKEIGTTELNLYSFGLSGKNDQSYDSKTLPVNGGGWQRYFESMKIEKPGFTLSLKSGSKTVPYTEKVSGYSRSSGVRTSSDVANLYDFVETKDSTSSFLTVSKVTKEERLEQYYLQELDEGGTYYKTKGQKEVKGKKYIVNSQLIVFNADGKSTLLESFEKTYSYACTITRLQLPGGDGRIHTWPAETTGVCDGTYDAPAYNGNVLEAKDGSLHAYYRRYEQNKAVGDYVVKSSDGGKTWSAKIEVKDLGKNSLPFMIPGPYNDYYFLEFANNVYTIKKYEKGELVSTKKINRAPYTKEGYVTSYNKLHLLGYFQRGSTNSDMHYEVFDLNSKEDILQSEDKWAFKKDGYSQVFAMSFDDYNRPHIFAKKKDSDKLTVVSNAGKGKWIEEEHDTGNIAIVSIPKFFEKETSFEMHAGGSMKKFKLSLAGEEQAASAGDSITGSAVGNGITEKALFSPSENRMRFLLVAGYDTNETMRSVFESNFNPTIRDLERCSRDRCHITFFGSLDPEKLKRKMIQNITGTEEDTVMVFSGNIGNASMQLGKTSNFSIQELRSISSLGSSSSNSSSEQPQFELVLYSSNNSYNDQYGKFAQANFSTDFKVTIIDHGNKIPLPQTLNLTEKLVAMGSWGGSSTDYSATS